MVDVSGKEPGKRRATATGRFHASEAALRALADPTAKKGDAFAVARIAGIMAAKRTSELIPLCHQIALTKVAVSFELDDSGVDVEAVAETTDRTGVEMEALTAVAVAGLTLHDMVKAVDPASWLGEVRVVRKEGGKTGLWTAGPE
ncbi:MAG: cyclic pyranopterin monophosphate synthase MoaC [Segniliparus sp.]|uniref:cyclic pyranopterin monophosphate synthase MoaC n=1 Tax=Segniliparus sp. TaxID=2804064 RepID=UPI003F37885A